jgi:hypothetical protein
VEFTGLVLLVLRAAPDQPTAAVGDRVVLSGGDSIDDVTVLRIGATQALFRLADKGGRSRSKICEGLPFGPLRGPNGSPLWATAGR